MSEGDVAGNANSKRFVQHWDCPKCGKKATVKRHLKSAGRRVQTWCNYCRGYKLILVPIPSPSDVTETTTIYNLRAEIERLKAELGNLFAATAPLLALVEQLAGALENYSPHAWEIRDEALAAAAAYRKEKP